MSVCIAECISWPGKSLHGPRKPSLGGHGCSSTLQCYQGMFLFFLLLVSRVVPQERAVSASLLRSTLYVAAIKIEPCIAGCSRQQDVLCRHWPCPVLPRVMANRRADMGSRLAADRLPRTNDGHAIDALFVSIRPSRPYSPPLPIWFFYFSLTNSSVCLRSTLLFSLIDQYA